MRTDNKTQKIPKIRPIVGVPLERTLAHADKVLFPLLMIAQQGFPFIRMNYGRTDLVRNKFAQHLLQSNFTHLIMLDVDHIHPHDIVQRLMEPFAKDPSLRVVGGLNFRRGEPFDPCAFIKYQGEYMPMSSWPNGLVQVDAIGTGSIAIAREVFELIPPPWFYNPYDKVMDDVWPGEDIGFALLCEKYGIKQHVLTTLTSPHLLDSVVDEETYRTYLANNPYETIGLETETPDEQPVA